MRCLLGILFFSTLLSCETIIEVSPPAYNPEVVATSHFNPDSIWSVTLHQSTSIGTKQNVSKLYESDASVTIMSGTELVDSLLYYGKGIYKSTTFKRPMTETSYTLKITTKNQITLSAQSSAPSRTLISDYSIQLQDELVNTPLGQFGLYHLWLEFEDVSGINMYEIGIYHYVPWQGASELSSDSIYQRLDNFVSVGPGWHCGFQSALEVEAEFRGGPGLGCNQLVASDRTFEERTHEWSATLQIPFNKSIGNQEILLLLTSYSTDYVEYARTLTENRDAGAFFEPISVYSNVEGGLGVFAGYTNTNLILPLSN